jgi:hypothetical protein
MKIVITEEQKKKLFIPRRIDERQEQLKKELIEKTKEILSHFNITEIIIGGRIDDYENKISGDDIQDGYNRLIIDGKNYYGFSDVETILSKVTDYDSDLVNDWEEMLAIYLNTVIPQPSDESINNASPNIVGRMFRVDITPSRINTSFSYSIVEYINKEGNETITL